MAELTTELLELDRTQDKFKAATQNAFLEHAGRGTLSKNTLQAYLTQDRLYALAYKQCITNTLSVIANSRDFTRKSQLVKMLEFSKENIKREIAWFETLSKDWALEIHVDYGIEQGNDITRKYAKLFNQVGQETQSDLGLLDCLTLLWATEYVYYQAWGYASHVVKTEISSGNMPDLEKDRDGGVARKELIPNWTSPEFKEFVDTLKDHLENYVRVLEKPDNSDKTQQFSRTEIYRRAESIWEEVLDLEAAFWPGVE